MSFPSIYQASATSASATSIEIVKKCPKETCPTSMIEYIGEMPDATLNDLLDFLLNGKYNVQLMNGIITLTEDGSTPWGPFHPIAEYAKGKEKHGRLFEASISTGNKYRENGKATTFLNHIVQAINTILENNQISHRLQMDSDKINGLVTVIQGNDSDEIYATLIDLADQFLNPHAGEIQ
jgi:hypothetical protein